MKKVYFISGLGADRRVFSLLDLSFCQPVFIDWIPPLKKEPLQNYALRMMESIEEKNTVVVGISFGGMLASEMARAWPNMQAILISSNKNSNEFPAYLRIGKYLPLYKIVPFKLVKKIYPAYNWVFGSREKETKKIINQLAKDADANFIKWAVECILKWKSSNAPANIIHIHGTADILLPYRFVKADYTIKGGKHVMALNKHQEISALLKKLLQ